MTNSFYFKEEKKLVQFVESLLDQEAEGYILTLTINWKPQGDCFVVNVTVDYDFTSPPTGSEQPPTTSKILRYAI